MSEECITEGDKTKRESRKKTGVKYAQFSLVGGSNALVDFGVLNLPGLSDRR